MIYPNFILPEGYASHSSSGEHATKHLGDLVDIERIRSDRDVPPLDTDDLRKWMFSGGIHTVRIEHDDGHFGEVVGYGVVDRSDDQVAHVVDVWTNPAHRRRGIAGYVIHKTLFQPGYHINGPASFAKYGPQREIAFGQGTIRTLQLSVLIRQTDPETLNRFLNSDPPSNMQLLRTVKSDEFGTYTELIDDGAVIDYRLDEKPSQDKLVPWALDGLNSKRHSQL